MSLKRKLDFLRQIVNVELAEKNVSPKVSDIVKSLVSSAEDKYNFSVFGGDPKKLADYLMSGDFEDVMKTLISNNYYQVLLDILNKVMEAYADDTKVIEAAKMALEKSEKIKQETEKELSSKKK
ncbi:MAG: hypothetical protein DRJ66_04535 [Thermoprotei archaeon]|nr:MAG: hypothetical protein DRJ66_04535 [Thermoprotei archaeon]RLF21044.1 MAG: hypothetical protein DRZ82_00205 [Thermoprotei archaeon]